MFKNRSVAYFLSLALGAVFTLALTAPAFAATPWEAPAEWQGIKNPVKATQASLAAGQKIFEKLCYLCHGMKGDGEGPSGKNLLVRPADFTNKALMGQQSDGALAFKISSGRNSMPQFAGQFSEEQLWNIINYIRQFTK